MNTQTEEHQAMVRAHVLNILKPIVPLLDPTEQNLVHNFLKTLFPKLLEHKIFTDIKPGVNIVENPWLLFQTVSINHIKNMGKKEIYNLQRILEYYPKEEDIITLIIQKIMEIDDKRGLDSTHIIHIDDDCDVLTNMFRSDTKKTSKDAGLRALLSLYDRYMKYPHTQDLILGRIRYYDSHIMLLAEDFCDGKTMLPAEDLNPFQLAVRALRLKANAQKTENQL